MKPWKWIALAVAVYVVYQLYTGGSIIPQGFAQYSPFGSTGPVPAPPVTPPGSLQVNPNAGFPGTVAASVGYVSTKLTTSQATKLFAQYPGIISIYDAAGQHFTNNV